jgi:protein farnesyltransferase subunit beta
MRLCKFAHLSYLKERLLKLPESQACLDASQPWLVYWTLHGLRLLHYEPSDSVIQDSVAFLNSCQNENGGFGGGPHQLSHLATTYASVNALAELACSAALEIINKTTLYSWLYSLRNESDGSFRMHHGGETDIRGCYCALSVASLCQIIDEKLTEKTAKWIASCQVSYSNLYFLMNVDFIGCI